MIIRNSVFNMCLSEGLVILRFLPAPPVWEPSTRQSLDISRLCFLLQGHGGDWEQTVQDSGI